MVDMVGKTVTLPKNNTVQVQNGKTKLGLPKLSVAKL